MYSRLPGINSPESEEAKIWRYIDFTKLVSLLKEGALYFCRADQLEDPYEGAYSRINHIIHNASDDIENCRRKETAARKNIYVNCWHINQYESAAMWKLYIRNNHEGVAIQSTYRKLCSCFQESEQEIFIGTVNYIDYDRQPIPEGELFYPFFYKRKSFEYEKELRAVTAAQAGWSPHPGCYIRVDLNQLVEAIYVSPTASHWFADLVRNVMIKYGLKKEVRQSSLAHGPFY